MITKKLVFECEKCGFDNNISIKLEGLDDLVVKSFELDGLDDLVLKHTNKRPYPKRRKYLDSRDDADLLSQKRKKRKR